jgi:hypothetical protein
MTSQDPRSGWKRLEERLVALKPGETVSVETLAAECGLADDAIEQVMAAMIASELFERSEDGGFARRGLVETTTFSDADGRATIVNGRGGMSGKRPLKT